MDWFPTCRRLCDMDAEEFMMHGFDSDVPDDDNEPEKTQKVSLNEVSQGKSQKHIKYE